MPIRHIPYWFDRFPRSRRPSYPRFRGDAETSVVIVGCGLTGAACALSFASAGVKTIVLEGDAIGASATARSLGIGREDFDASFQETAAAHGLRSARLLWQHMRRASLDFPAALRRIEARCDLTTADLVTFARRDPESVRRLLREYQARRDAGFDHRWIKPAALARDAAAESGGAIRTHGFSLDPYRASVAVAAAAAARGAVIYERSPVRRIRATRKHVDVTSGDRTIRAEAVVIATGAPLADLRALRRHLKAQHSYAVVTAPLPAAMRREVGSRGASLRDSGAPPHFVRWLRDDRVMFSGGDQPAVPPRQQDKALVQRTWDLMYELSLIYPAISGLQPEWSWDFTHYETVDRLPFIGLHRNFPRHLFAIEGARHGAAFAWLAARILVRHYQGEPAKGDELFGFSRVL
jgi:glycine/D-amino acid oxidase-like deaminating enzyme